MFSLLGFVYDCLSFFLFLLAIALTVLRILDSDNFFGIVRLFSKEKNQVQKNNNIAIPFDIVLSTMQVVANHDPISVTSVNLIVKIN